MEHNGTFAGVPANGGPVPFANGTPPAGDMSAVPPPSGGGGSQEQAKTTLW